MKKLPLEKLHSNDGEDEHEEDVNDEDVEYILQRVHYTIKHGLGTQKQHKSDLLQTVDSLAATHAVYNAQLH